MFALPLLFATLATASPAAYPQGFMAHCTGGHTAWVGLNAENKPTQLNQSAGGSGTFDILYVDKHFAVRSYNDDVVDTVENGERGWRLEVLRQAPGDLVLLLQSTGHTFLHAEIYHLQFTGRSGGLLVSTTAYGSPQDVSSLASLSCRIELSGDRSNQSSKNRGQR